MRRCTIQKKVSIRCVSCFSQKWIINRARERERKWAFIQLFISSSKIKTPEEKLRPSMWGAGALFTSANWGFFWNATDLTNSCCQIVYLIDLIRSSPSPLQTAVFVFSSQASSLPSPLLSSNDENSRYVLEWLDYSDMLCCAKLRLRNTCCHNGCDQNLWKPLS